MGVVSFPAVSLARSKEHPAEMGHSGHIQLLLAQKLPEMIRHYKDCLRVVYNDPVVPQTSKVKGTTLTPNYLCLHCTETVATAQSSVKHGAKTGHRICKFRPR
jgi:hypothetical protein